MKNRNMLNDYIQTFTQSGAHLFLLMLVLADTVFIGLNVIRSILNYYGMETFLKSNLFEIGHDHGYAEVYQYVKEFWIVVLMLTIFFKTKERGYIAWSLLFIYLLIDDAACIHERVGTVIASHLDFHPILGLRLQDIGELSVTAISASFLLTLIIYSCVIGSKIFRYITIDLLIFLMAIGFFGVFIDMAHMAFRLGREGNFMFRIIEDGGEMLTMSLVACYIYFARSSQSIENVPLFNIIYARLFNRFAQSPVVVDNV